MFKLRYDIYSLNPLIAKHDYNRLLVILLADQITISGNKMSV